MAHNTFLTVSFDELRSFARSVRNTVPAAESLSQQSTSALATMGPALGGEAANAASELCAVWAAADNAYLQRLRDTADQIDSSATLYEDTDSGEAQSLHAEVSEEGSMS